MWIWVYSDPKKKDGAWQSGASIPNEEIHGVVG
jgi:hypothetical protein